MAGLTGEQELLYKMYGELFSDYLAVLAILVKDSIDNPEAYKGEVGLIKLKDISRLANISSPNKVSNILTSGMKVNGVSSFIDQGLIQDLKQKPGSHHRLVPTIEALDILKNAADIYGALAVYAQNKEVPYWESLNLLGVSSSQRLEQGKIVGSYV